MKYVKLYEEFIINPLVGIGAGILIGLTWLGIQELTKLFLREPTKKLIKEIVKIIDKYKDDPEINRALIKINNDRFKDIEYQTRYMMNRFEELMEPDEFKNFKYKVNLLSKKQLYNINLSDFGPFQL